MSPTASSESASSLLPSLRRGWWRLLLVLALTSIAATMSVAGPLDELSLDRWSKLRETERYQLNIAEKYYRDGAWKVALSEYEKFLSLHEKSDGASYAQLKWGLCQVQLRKSNTAIKDGFQSILDYWPNSPDSVTAAYLIGRTYKEMGEAKKAKKAYAKLLSDHGKDFMATLARVDLAEIAQGEGDNAECVRWWKELVFQSSRPTPEQAAPCEEASRRLAVYSFQAGAAREGIESLATTYAKPDLPYQIVYWARGPITTLVAAEETKARGEQVANEATAWLREQAPADISGENDKQLARRYWNAASELNIVAKRFDAAKETHDSIRGLFGEDDDLRTSIAAWHKAQGARDKAREIYRGFKDPILGEKMVAESYYEEQKYDQAAIAYRQLAEHDTDHAADWQGSMAWMHRLAHQFDEAVAAYRALMQSDVARINQWQFEMGHAYREAGQLKEAIATYRECENYPDNYHYMAWCHRALKEHSEAILLYREVMVGHEPSAPWALLQIGYTQEEADQKEQAIRSFQQVCRKFPKSSQASEAHAHLQNQYKITATLGGATEE